ncbi:hypothetical protein VCRLGP8_370171 [Vibrio crassostreae]|nr:hypothetical protein VCRLGP107_170171 [Vibrio crassostreae]CDT47064.1 hypothetical protein VCRLGP8_370171 [Vibrio crassostreae]CDT65999.1 hypothetical protein VCRLGP7_920151 [Vibrio crassostreae]
MLFLASGTGTSTSDGAADLGAGILGFIDARLWFSGYAKIQVPT